MLQEFKASDKYLALIVIIHPGRWMNAAKDNEGIMYRDFLKSDLSITNNGSSYHFYDHNGGKGVDDTHYRTDYLRSRRYSESGYTFAPNMGNFYGWKYGNYAGFQFISWYIYYASNWQDRRDKFHVCYQKNAMYSEKPTWTFSSTEEGRCVNRVYPRFIMVGDYVYNIFSNNYYGVFLSRTKYDTAFDYELHVTKAENAAVGDFYYECCGHFRSVEGVYGDLSPYDHDFCIIKANDGTLICGMLGFMGKGKYSKLPDKKPWTDSDNDYVACDDNHCMLMFSSFKMTIPPTNAMSAGSRVLPQNMLYCTHITRGTDVANVRNFSATDDKRLYLNTHKICTYKSQKTGYEYLFYCYCYPGKTKQLFLGYAPYYIDKSDNYNVVLLTKTEFRDQNGDSFGNFTSCSRIISMDCRNGQLWITWMNKDNSLYCVFHIKAEDLIGDS